MEHKFKTIIEPFRIKMVEQIKMSTQSQRQQWLKDANYNTFQITSDHVMIDMLTDSGTSAMSDKQWAGMMVGDESYAGARSWKRMEKVVKDLTGYAYILPTHQGRAAERILYGHLGGEGKTFISNTHFDTTRANIEYSGAEAIDIVIPEGADPQTIHPFKGNMDIGKVEELIRLKGSENVAAVILTVTNNSGGGQPVSMQNAKSVSEICKREHIRFFLDACRIAENAWFIKDHEDGYQDKTYKEIAQEMFRLADGCVMSAKKDAIVNMGGFLALKEETLALECTNSLFITEGFTTYGGLSGRDMEALAIGLEEVFESDYLEYRIRSTNYLGHQLMARDVPVLMPIGGHAVYIDAKAFYPDIPIDEYPGQKLVCDLYELGGIRSCEIGSVMFGKYDEQGKLIPNDKELVRLAIPRRVYTQSHIDYVIEVFELLAKMEKPKCGVKILKEAHFLRHFTAQFEPIDSAVLV